jgi:hypothetical protein
MVGLREFFMFHKEKKLKLPWEITMPPRKKVLNCCKEQPCPLRRMGPKLLQGVTMLSWEQMCLKLCVVVIFFM